MFRSIQDKIFKNTKEETKGKKSILANVFSAKYIMLYVVTFMASQVSMGHDVSPFSLSLVAAAAASEIPVIGVIVIGLVGNVITSGTSSIAIYIVTLLLFFASFLVKQPIYNDIEKNEKIRNFIFVTIILTIILGIIVNLISGFLF